MTSTAVQPELEIAAAPTKRETIDSELHRDASRSDREIARVCDVDHKTVAARRRKMGIAAHVGNSPPIPSESEWRDMLVAGAKDFGNKFPTTESPEAVVDRMIADGKISYATAGSGGGAGETEPDDEGGMVLCPRQLEITIHFNADGDAVLRQANWPDDDHMIIICRDNIPQFIDRLTDALGIPSIGRPG